MFETPSKTVPKLTGLWEKGLNINCCLYYAASWLRSRGRTNKCWAVAEMGDRLATTDMGWKLGAVPLLGVVARSPSNTMWPGPRPTSVPSGTLINSAIWPQQTWAKKWGLKWGLCPFYGELGPHLTQCRLGRSLPLYQVASWSIQPFGHNRHGQYFLITISMPVVFPPRTSSEKGFLLWHW